MRHEIARISTESIIDRSPAEVWEVVRDVGNISDWFDGMEESRVQADIRYCTLAIGGKLVEQIVSLDDENRTYSYRITAGMPVQSHQADVRAEEHPDRTKLLWITNVEPEPIAEMMGPGFDSALGGLKSRLESS